MTPTTGKWQPIPSAPGYFASDSGTVYCDRLGRTLRASTNAYGYQVVGIFGDDGKRRLRFVHRLVLEAFVGPCPEGMEGCHCDGDRSNNAIRNLRWDTHAGNMQDAVHHGTHSKTAATHCPRRHLYSAENTYIDGRGRRNCRTCRRLLRAQRAAVTGAWQ